MIKMFLMLRLQFFDLLSHKAQMICECVYMSVYVCVCMSESHLVMSNSATVPWPGSSVHDIL